MNEASEIQVPEIITPKDGTIRGEVLIGLTHPAHLTREQFDNSPQLLFHGSGREFEYAHSGIFDKNSVVGDGTSDYGAGFYTTDNKQQAESYSIARSGDKTKPPVVYSFLPYNSRMLDVRNANNPDTNGELPKKFVQEWINFLENRANDESRYSHLSQFIKDAITSGIKEKFLDPLKVKSQRGEPVTIRSGSYKQAGIFQRDSNGLIDVAFQEFMLSKGYDGMIYREGGEGPYADNLTGYIFFNPKAVDTYEGWQKRK